MRSAPTRMILDTRCRTSPDAEIVRSADSAPVIVFSSDRAPRDRVERLQGAGARVEMLPEEPGGLWLDALLDWSWDAGLRAIFCEGGGQLAGSLIRQRKANRLYLFLAPFVLGEGGVPAFPDTGEPELWREWTRHRQPAVFGEDLLLTFDRMD